MDVFEKIRAQQPAERTAVWMVGEQLADIIRHARRPERSWYTLNINTTGDRPARIQLHSYGNEWAHGVSLNIPQRVLDFVSRWETEILAPTFRAVRAEQAKAKSPRKSRQGAA